MIELEPEELAEVTRQVVDRDINGEVERAIGPIRSHSKRCMFAGTALVVALIALALMTGDDRTLGPAFVFGIVCACWIVPVLLKSRKRRIEVRVKWLEARDPGSNSMAFRMEFRDRYREILPSIRKEESK